jgi:F-type H+-transporting ATPase subunit epsilon
MSSSANKLQCVIVTPERTVLDEPADFVAVPLYDGEAGMAPGRAPLIARLGYGELRARSGDQVRRYYIDGGFVQVQKDVVSVLTAGAIPAGEIDVPLVSEQLENSRSRVPSTPDEFAAKERIQLQLRGQLAVASRSARSS